MANLQFIRGASAAAILAFGVPFAELDAAQAHQESAQPSARAAEAEADEKGSRASSGIKIFDAAAARPVTFLSSVFSAGAFVLALPFAAFDPAMDVRKTRKNLVDYPFDYTFRRPLGDFNESVW